jgi:phosphohistidine phosphatase
MDLYFLRHGEAEPASTAGSDDDRTLTERGRRDVRAVAELARRAGVQPEAIYTSPLLRARQTSDILADVFGVAATAVDQLASGPRLGDFQPVAGESGHQRILLVGHEPHLSGLVGTLTGGHVKMQTASFAHVRADRLEPDGGTLMCLLSPDFSLAPEADPRG